MFRFHAISSSCCCFALGAASLCIPGMVCGQSAADATERVAGAPATVPATAPAVDRAKWQADVLRIAYAAASAIPVTGHDRDRARSQHSVVSTCADLGLLDEAQRYAREIEGWRQGVAYAEIAAAMAHPGDATAATLFEKASQVADAQTDWRRDRILQSIAAAQAQVTAADPLSLSSGSLSGDAAATTAAADMALARSLEQLEAAVASEVMEDIRTSASAVAAHFDRTYGDPAQRERLQTAILGALPLLPLDLQIDTLLQLSGIAGDHKDLTTAIAFVDDAQKRFDSMQWTHDFGLPLRARIAASRHRAGAPAEAAQQADQVIADFDQHRLLIFNIDRAELLCAVAEALHSMGRTVDALEAYRRAAVECMENPNSRPRAMDLCLIGCSMASIGVEPDAELLDALKTNLGRLADPW